MKQITEKQKQQIIMEYQNGKSGIELSKKYGYGTTTIYRILQNGTALRSLSQARRNSLNYTLNEDIFNSINTPDKAYWLGVMYSDGYISKARKYTNSLGIAVNSQDIEWLEKFKNFLNYNGHIKKYKNTGSYSTEANHYARLIIGNNKIVSDLEKWGVVEHKTKIISHLPQINFLDDFIRGYIDGDGSLRTKFPNITIAGNYDFLKAIGDYFQLPYHIYPDKTIYSLRYNTKESEYLEKRLYKNANYYLARKYEIAKRSFNSPLTLEDVKEKSE